LQTYCQSYVNANNYPASDVECIFCTSRLANMPMNTTTVHNKLLWMLCTISLTIHYYYAPSSPMPLKKIHTQHPWK